MIPSEKSFDADPMHFVCGKARELFAARPAATSSLLLASQVSELLHARLTRTAILTCPVLRLVLVR